MDTRAVEAFRQRMIEAMTETKYVIDNAHNVDETVKACVAIAADELKRNENSQLLLPALKAYLLPSGMFLPVGSNKAVSADTLIASCTPAVVWDALNFQVDTLRQAGKKTREILDHDPRTMVHKNLAT